MMKKPLTTTSSLLLIIILCIYGCRPSQMLERQELIKDYALCSCILNLAKSDSIVFKNDISKAIYREIAGYEPRDYDRIDSLIKSRIDHHLPLQINDYQGKSAAIKDCIDIYKSHLLDSLIKQITTKRMGVQ